MSETKKKKLFNFKGERTAASIIIFSTGILYLISLFFELTLLSVGIIALISTRATYELITATGCKNKLLLAASCTGSLLYILSIAFSMSIPMASLVIPAYILLLLSISVFQFSNGVKFIDCIVAIFASTAMPYAFSCFIRLANISDIMPQYTVYEGLLLVLFATTSSWGTDGFAFLVGRKIGKHKLSPNISPKKSVEGAVGGLILAAAMNALILFISSTIYTSVTGAQLFALGNIKYLYLLPICIVLSLVSMVGDLAASVLKRNVGIKDFSQLLPGHGGMVDRFDSCLFVIVLLYGFFEVVSTF